MTQPLIELDGAEASYGRVPVLFDLDVRVEEGEAVAVLGANGAGKTTLLRTIMGQVKLTGGSLKVGGEDVTLTSTHLLARRGFLLVPEGRGVLSFMTVRDNLLLGVDLAEPTGGGPDNDDRWDQVLDLFPILGDRLGQLAGELSGGQQQMLAVARAILARPRCLMLDEPSLGLAPRLIGETFSALRLILERFGTTLLLAEQNVGEALELATRVYVLERGRVVIERAAAELAGDSALTEAYLGGSWTADDAAERPRD